MAGPDFDDGAHFGVLWTAGGELFVPAEGGDGSAVLGALADLNLLGIPPTEDHPPGGVARDARYEPAHIVFARA